MAQNGGVLMRITAMFLIVSLLVAGQAASQINTQQQSAQDVLQIDRLELQDLVLPPVLSGPFHVAITLGGEVLNLELAPHSVRAPNFQLLVQQSDGSLASAEPVRGVITGKRDSVVAGSLSGGRLTALARVDGQLIGVESVFGRVKGASPASHAVYFAGDVRPLPGSCLQLPSPTGLPMTYAGLPSNDKVAEIAIDSDFEFYAGHGSIGAAQSDIEAVFEGMDAIFIGDTGIYNVVTRLIIRPTEPDPYGSNNPSGALNEFASEWINNQSSVPRDYAQFYTGKGWDGLTVGLAYMGPTVCNAGAHYSAVRTKASGNMMLRVALSAHEAGHTWGAGHCNGQSDCKIMCSQLNGCNGASSFGSSAIGSLMSTKSNAGCLSSLCGGFVYGHVAGNSASITSGGEGAPGSTLTITYADPPSATSTAFAAISYKNAQINLAAGVLLVDPATLTGFTPGVTFTSKSETRAEHLNIPNAPTLVGRSFCFQGAFFDGGPLAALSNGVRIIICD